MRKRAALPTVSADRPGSRTGLPGPLSVSCPPGLTAGDWDLRIPGPSTCEVKLRLHGRDGRLCDAPAMGGRLLHAALVSSNRTARVGVIFTQIHHLVNEWMPGP